MMSHANHVKRVLLPASLLISLATCMLACDSGSSGGTLTTPPGGNNYDDAIKVGSIGEERDIMNRWSCDGDGHYRKAHVLVDERDGRHYDIIDAECSKGSEHRQFFFDVSSCFPCPD